MATLPNLSALEAQLDQLRCPDGFLRAGIPNYEHLFGRDACVTSLQLLHREPETARATLVVLAANVGKKLILRGEEVPGKILHEHFAGGIGEMLHDFLAGGNRLRQLFTYVLWRFPYYGSVDSSAWYLILLHHYVKQTGDTELLKKLWPTAMGIITWLNTYGIYRKLGLVSYKRRYIFGLKSQSWKDTINGTITPPVAMIEVQGYYFYALQLLAELAQDYMNDEAAAESLRSQATALQAAFNEHFVPINGSYPMAVDGDGAVTIGTTSNPGHLLFTGILNANQEEEIAARLTKDDMLTPYGIRTEATSEPGFNPYSYQNGSIWPFDNWVVHQGLIKIGHQDEAAIIAQGMMNIYTTWGNLPELYAVELNGTPHGINDACRIQAWSAGALINMAAGVEPI